VAIEDGAHSPPDARSRRGCQQPNSDLAPTLPAGRLSLLGNQVGWCSAPFGVAVATGPALRSCHPPASAQGLPLQHHADDLKGSPGAIQGDRMPRRVGGPRALDRRGQLRGVQRLGGYALDPPTAGTARRAGPLIGHYRIG
jgi:hypothetical protein